jgi:hypothetical protein
VLSGPRSVPTRRTALGGALLGLGALAGCDLGSSSERPSGRGASAADPDAALVDRVVDELDELAALVRRVGSRFEVLSVPMTALGSLHAAHRRALAGADEAPAGTGTATVRLAGPADALGRVRVREGQAQRRLVDWSVAAESGALARLLACMSAGVAQQLVVLPRGVGTRR